MSNEEFEMSKKEEEEESLDALQTTHTETHRVSEWERETARERETEKEREEEERREIREGKANLFFLRQIFHWSFSRSWC